MKAGFNFQWSEKINYGDQLIFFGSCFSEEIGKKAQNAGLNVLINPYGVVYSPIAMADLLINTISDLPFQRRTLKREDVYLDWSCAGSVYAMSEDELAHKLELIKQSFKEKLSRASVLFVSFGTSFSYSLNSTQAVVSNCHKQPAELFQKKMNTLDEMSLLWKSIYAQLKVFNPKLQIVFTVSPVRHIKDGIVENSRSKSRLLLLCEQLISLQDTLYFPSFELMIDELRDFSYYNSDTVHPNEKAIEIIWDRVKETMVSKQALLTMREVLKYKTMLSHKLLYPESRQSQEFLKNLEQTKNDLLNQNPLIQL